MWFNSGISGSQWIIHRPVLQYQIACNLISIDIISHHGERYNEVVYACAQRLHMQINTNT